MQHPSPWFQCCVAFEGSIRTPQLGFGALCGLAFRCFGLNDTREHGSRLLDGPGDFGRRSIEKSDELCTQFIKRRQIGERFHAVRVEDGLAHRAAEDHELVVALGIRDGCLRRGNRE